MSGVLRGLETARMNEAELAAYCRSKGLFVEQVVAWREDCSNNFDEEIGNLKGQLLRDFCVREIGPSIYNQAVPDAQTVMQEKVAELETNCYETEFAYWQKKR